VIHVLVCLLPSKPLIPLPLVEKLLLDSSPCHNIHT
jgi:hypothetical protein